jgi:hypothetical protein
MPAYNDGVLCFQEGNTVSVSFSDFTAASLSPRSVRITSPPRISLPSHECVALRPERQSLDTNVSEPRCSFFLVLLAFSLDNASLLK